MSEKNNVISPELWAPLEQEEKNAEKMERPSLTFLQDGWRRLKSNKIAILSLIVIALITIGAIFIPCVQRSWITLAGVSPVTVIASEPCS